MMHFFVDTDVLIDVLAERHPFAEDAVRVFDSAAKNKVGLFISALSYSHIYYIIKKFSGHRETIKILHSFSEFTETLDVTKDIISAALLSDFKDFEDAIQYHCALSSKRVTGIITRNTRDYKTSELPVLSPRAALATIQSAE